jgi:hypothetical protein
MKATPKIDRAGALAGDAVIPIAGDGGLFVQCVVYDPPGSHGRTVDVFIPAEHVDGMLRELRDKAVANRRPGGSRLADSARSPLLEGPPVPSKPPVRRGPRTVVVDDLLGDDRLPDDPLRDAAEDVMRDFFKERKFGGRP